MAVEAVTSSLLLRVCVQNTDIGRQGERGNARSQVRSYPYSERYRKTQTRGETGTGKRRKRARAQTKALTMDCVSQSTSQGALSSTDKGVQN